MASPASSDGEPLYTDTASVLLTARKARRRKAEPVMRGGMRALLQKMRERHLAYAAMHAAAARSRKAYHRRFTVAIIALSVLTTIATNAATSYDANSEYIDVYWYGQMSNGALAIIGCLTAINNFLGYARRGEQHLNANKAHMRAKDLIDIAFACDDEDPTSRYDYGGVLQDLQDIHDSLRNISVEIPGWIAKKYPQYEAPWLVSS